MKATPAQCKSDTAWVIQTKMWEAEHGPASRKAVEADHLGTKHKTVTPDGAVSASETRQPYSLIEYLQSIEVLARKTSTALDCDRAQFECLPSDRCHRWPALPSRPSVTASLPITDGLSIRTSHRSRIRSCTSLRPRCCTQT